MTNDPKTPETIFGEAIAIESPADRAAFLDKACADHPELRRELEKLVMDHFRAGDFLENAAIRAGATLDQPPLERPGTQIGPYKLRQQLGEGGMGVVFVAEQIEPVRRKVALKVIKPGMDTRHVIARFEAERQALAVMDHPNIARVFDAGTTDSGRPYFVMELIKGIPITQYCDEHHLTPRQRLELFVPVCQAVQHAHQKGIIHRDIKPSNILVAEYDDRPVPKVIDFGIAKAVEQHLAEKSIFTNLGQVVGTIHYMSPEQARLNQLDIDTRSDIYSLGVVLYELLAGQTPFDRQRLQSAAFDEMLRIIREEEPPLPSLRLSSSHSLPSIAANRHTEPQRLSTLVHGELDWIVMKALEKDRTRRYETANNFAADIQRHLSDEPVEACPPSAAYRFRKFARRNKAALLVSALILFFLMLLGSGMGWTIRDRVARQTRVSEQVALILDEVARFEQQQKWPEALAVAKRAELALAGGDVSPDLQTRVEQSVADLEMVGHLEDIRFFTSEIRGQGFAYQEANRKYTAAFEQYGVDVDVLPADEAAAWLRSRAGVLPALIVALDEWSRCRREVKDEAGAKTLTDLAQALDSDPWRRRVREALAVKNTKALEELAGSADAARQTPSTVGLVARALETSERRKLALAVLGTALREHPDDFWLHFVAAKANAFSDPPRDHEAIHHYSAALALRPRSVAVLNSIGGSLRNLGKPDEAIACYRKAIEIDPTFAMAHGNLGVDLELQGKLDEAIACYRKAIDLNPKHVSANHNLGVALYRQGKLDEAIAFYRKVVELDLKHEAVKGYRAYTPERIVGTAHANLGIALKDQGKLDEAIACYRKSIELNPKETTAHTGLCIALADQGKWSEAEAVCRTAVKVELDMIGQVPVGHTRAQLYDLACFYSRASAAAKADPKKAEEHAAQAVALLRKAHTAAGWAKARKDHDLDALRNRDDFRRLLQELEQKGKK